MKATDGQGPILLTLTLIPACIHNYIQYGVKLFIYSQTAAIEVWEWISYFIVHFIMDVITYPYDD